MKSARFVLSLNPSLNASYADVIKRNRAGKAYTKRVATEALKQFKDDAPILLYQQGLIRDSWREVKAVGMELAIYVPTLRSDADNRLKAYQDAVAGYLGFDDHLVIDVHFSKHVDKQNPRIEGYWFTIEK